MDHRTQMVVEVDGIEEVRNIDYLERPDALNGPTPLWIKQPV